ncbi:MAG TPA: hypothetical protein VFT50_14285 [Baekduia sp.]|nr:hypothetical protein [Baekduia sp.]
MTPPEPRPAAPAARPARKSSEERNAEVRAHLRPLDPGERPAALVVAVVLALALAAVNVVLLAAGQGGRPEGLVVYCALMLLIASGMWTRRYAAVLAFECLLAIAVTFGFLFLLRASSPLDLLICFVLIVPTGWLFWKLIRVLARLQAPPRDGVQDGPRPT